MNFFENPNKTGVKKKNKMYPKEKDGVCERRFRRMSPPTISLITLSTRPPIESPTTRPPSSTRKRSTPQTTSCPVQFFHRFSLPVPFYKYNIQIVTNNEGSSEEMVNIACFLFMGQNTINVNTSNKTRRNIHSEIVHS